MKRHIGMSYRRALCLAAAGLLAALLLWLGIALYGHATRETADLMSTADRIHLSSKAFEINSSLGDTMKACQYLKQSGRFLQYVAACLDENVSMGEQAKAFTNMQNMLSLVMNGDRLIRSIIVTAPGRRFHNSMDTLFVLNLTMDSVATGDIRFHIPEGINYYGAQNRDNLNMSDYPHFAFTLGETGEIGVFVVLHESFLHDLLGGDSDVVLLSGDQMLYGAPAAQEGSVSFAGLARDAAQETIHGPLRIYRAEIAQAGWTILYLRDQQAYTQVYQYVFLLILCSVIASVLLSLTLSRILFHSALQPLRLLMHALGAYRTPGQTRMLEAARESARPRHSLREKLFVYLMVTVFIPILLLTAVFSYGASEIRQKHLLLAHTAMVQNMAGTFERHFSRKEMALERIAYDSAIMDALRDPENPDHETLLMQAVQENTYFNIDESRVDIYDAEGALLYTNNMLAQGRIDPETVRAGIWKTEQNPLGDIALTLTAGVRPNRFFLQGVWAYVKLTENFRFIDYLMLTLSADAQMLAFTDEAGVSLRDGTHVAIDTSLPKTRDGVYITPTEGGISIARPIGRTPYLITASFQAPGYGTAFISLLAQHALMFIVMLLLIVITAYLLSRMLLRPLETLAGAMAVMEPGNPALRAPVFFIDEIDEIGHSFNEMADRVDSLVDDLVLSNSAKLRLENERKNAEIIALQMQINPHFLSNTIEGISNMILDGRADLARTMLYAMNNLFRYGISRPGHIITVAEEVAYAKAYVEIMSHRYPSIRFVWAIDPALEDRKTVKLILQPVIENAIYHGINRVDAHGEIIIACYGEAGQVCFEVRDNGAGIAPRQLSTLRENLRDARLGNVIGLFNVQARVRLQFGEAYGLDIESAPGQGCTVRIRMPG